MENSPLQEPTVLSSTPRWIAVFKPPGWLTIPGRPKLVAEGESFKSPVLLEWVQRSNSKVWVVHRLDKETSGVILFARTSADHAEANRWFQDRKVKKVYFCLSNGRSDLPFFKITHAIKGAPSITQVEIIENLNGCFLAKVYPRTGRRHQIRIHMSQAGFPILGDPLYGGPTEFSESKDRLAISFSRVALHASSLEFPTGEKFEAPFPEDFLKWTAALKGESTDAGS